MMKGSKLNYLAKELPMAEKNYDNESQYKRIVACTIPNETVHAVYDCKGGGTGFVGITDQRVIFYDQGFLTKKKSIVSIPYNQVVGVAFSDEGGGFLFGQSSELTLITAAGKFTFEFFSTGRVQSAYQYIIGQILNQINPQLKG
jgi:hypothetical protein